MAIKDIFRGDAAFASSEIYELLEYEGYWYAIRLKSNSVLERHIEQLLTRPEIEADGKPVVGDHNFEYQAASWAKPRRGVAEVTWFADQLFPAVGFIVTNLNCSARRVVDFYNQRGTGEQWINESKYALKWSRQSWLFRKSGAVGVLCLGQQPGVLTDVFPGKI